MRPMLIIGIVLIALGVLGLIYQGVTYTTHEQVAKVGPVTVEQEKQKTIPIPAIVGGLALAGGVAIVVVASRKPSS